MGQPVALLRLSTAYGNSGEINEGLRMATEALAVIDKTEVRRPEAEAHRLKGELLLKYTTPDYQQAETCFHQALDVARHQQAKSWELRAATSLSRLWQQQDRCQEAHDLLAPVYGWFTEGFDTADLIDAKGLLDELGA